MNNLLIYTNQKKWIKNPIKNNIIYLKEYERFRCTNSSFLSYFLSKKDLNKDNKLNGYYFINIIKNAYIEINHHKIKICVYPYLSREACYLLISDLSHFYNASLPVSINTSDYKDRIYSYTYIDIDNHDNLLNSINNFIKQVNKILYHYLCLRDNFENSFDVIYKHSNRPVAIDAKSNQMNMVHPYIKGLYYPVKVKNYNVISNKLLKVIFTVLLHDINKLCHSFRILIKYLIKLNVAEQKYGNKNKFIYTIFNKFKTKLEMINKKRLSILLILHSNFMKQIHVNNYVIYPFIYQFSELPYEYRALLLNYYSIKHSQLNLMNSNNSYKQLTIKHFYYLYEIWTYMQTIKVFQSLGFHINSNYSKDLRHALYYLRHDCNVWLFKYSNNYLIKVNLVYNGKANRDNSQTNPFMILDNRKTEAHDNPDIMAHIYINHQNQNIYIGSIILDAKCMYKERIFEKKRDRNQFKEYLNNIHFFKNNVIYTRYRRNIKPMIFVFALYPMETYTTGLGQINHNGFFYQKLTPLFRHQHKFIINIRNCLRYFLVVNSNIPIENIFNL